jgi:hypothetical protein
LYQKCAKTRLRASVISKHFAGYTPGAHCKSEGKGTEERGEEGKRGEEERGGKGEEKGQLRGSMGNLAPYLFRKVGTYGYLQ